MIDTFSKSVFLKALFSIFAALVIGLVCIFTGSYIIEKESLNKLIYVTKNEANQLETPFVTMEKSTDNLSYIISGIIYTKKFNAKTSYKANYLEQMDKLITKFSNNKDLQEIYIYLNPEYSLNKEQNTYFYTRLSNKELLQRKTIKKNNDDYLKTLYFDEKHSNNENNFLKTKNSKGRWSDPYTDKISGLYTIAYEKPIILNNEFIGFVKINISIDSFLKSLSKIKVYDNDSSFLLDNCYCFISNEKNDKLKSIKENNLFLNNLTAKLKTNNNGIVTYKSNGIKMIASFARIENGFNYLIIAPEKEVYQQEYNLQRLITGIIFVGIILFTLIILNI